MRMHLASVLAAVVAVSALRIPMPFNVRPSVEPVRVLGFTEPSIDLPCDGCEQLMAGRADVVDKQVEYKIVCLSGTRSVIVAD